MIIRELMHTILHRTPEPTRYQLIRISNPYSPKPHYELVGDFAYWDAMTRAMEPGHRYHLVDTINGDQWQAHKIGLRVIPTPIAYETRTDESDAVAFVEQLLGISPDLRGAA